jgi:hypothetical protein
LDYVATISHEAVRQTLKKTELRRWRIDERHAVYRRHGAAHPRGLGALGQDAGERGLSGCRLSDPQQLSRHASCAAPRFVTRQRARHCADLLRSSRESRSGPPRSGPSESPPPGSSPPQTKPPPTSAHTICAITSASNTRKVSDTPV